MSGIQSVLNECKPLSSITSTTTIIIIILILLATGSRLKTEPVADQDTGIIRTENQDNGWISVTLYNSFSKIPFLCSYMTFSTKSYFKPTCLGLVKTTYGLELVSRPSVWTPSNGASTISLCKGGLFGPFISQSPHALHSSHLSSSAFLTCLDHEPQVSFPIIFSPCLFTHPSIQILLL